MSPLARTWVIFLLIGMLAGCSDSPQEQAPAKPLDEASVKEFQAYKAKAEQGDAEAQNMVGRCYSSRRGVERDYVQAVAWYRKAAEQGLAVAQYNLGLCYYHGTGVPWCGREDSIGTWRKLGILFEERKGRRIGSTNNNIDEIEAYAYYKLASSSNERAREKLEELESSMSEERLEKAKKRANELGAMIASTRATVEEAARYLKAASLGDPKAQFNIGLCHQEGRGVAKDEKLAFTWYRKAAVQGDAGAQNKLGDCYYRGLGVETDQEQALLWWRASANQGQADAQNSLGDFYSDKVSSFFLRKVAKPRDIQQAISWYQKAAEQDHARAQHSLGTCYHDGIGVSKDLDQAVSWYRKAAEQGLDAAQHDLALCYANGEGVTKDVIEAYAYLNLRPRRLSYISSKKKREFEANLTPEQIAAGQKRAAVLQQEIEDKIAANETKVTKSNGK
jgi:TPR repeat protein